MPPNRHSPHAVPAARIFVAHEHGLVRLGLRALVNQVDAWRVCGEADDGRDALEGIRREKPDVVVADRKLRSLNGLDLARQAKRELPHTGFVIVCEDESPAAPSQSLAAGASAYVLHRDAGRDIVPAIEALLNGRTWVSASVGAALARRIAEPGTSAPVHAAEALTPREREVLQLVVEGRTNKQIASTLGLAVKTIEGHRARLMSRVQAKSLSDLVRFAIRSGIVHG